MSSNPRLEAGVSRATIPETIWPGLLAARPSRGTAEFWNCRFLKRTSTCFWRSGPRAESRVASTSVEVPAANERERSASLGSAPCWRALFRLLRRTARAGRPGGLFVPLSGGRAALLVCARNGPFKAVLPVFGFPLLLFFRGAPASCAALANRLRLGLPFSPARFGRVPGGPPPFFGAGSEPAAFSASAAGLFKARFRRQPFSLVRRCWRPALSLLGAPLLALIERPSNAGFFPPRFLPRLSRALLAFKCSAYSCPCHGLIGVFGPWRSLFSIICLRDNRRRDYGGPSAMR